MSRVCGAHAEAATQSANTLLIGRLRFAKRFRLHVHLSARGIARRGGDGERKVYCTAEFDAREVSRDGYGACRVRPA